MHDGKRRIVEVMPVIRDVAPTRNQNVAAQGDFTSDRDDRVRSDSRAGAAVEVPVLTNGEYRPPLHYDAGVTDHPVHTFRHELGLDVDAARKVTSS